MDVLTTLALTSWKTVNQMIDEFREDQIKAMLDHEVATKKRENVIERLHQRYCKLRMQRERAELMAVIK